MKELQETSMQDLKPTVWIGKQGCTATMIEEIVAQLKKRDQIKVKWLQNCEVDPAAVATEAKALLVSVRGRTMVLKGKKGVAKSKAPVQDTTKKPAANRSRRNGDPVARSKRF